MLQVRLPGQRRPLFYGWLVVGAGLVDQSILTGLGMLGFGSFLTPLQKEFGWSKTVLAGARSLTQLQDGILGPAGGFIVDRMGPRFSMALGIFLFGLGMMLFGLIQSLWAYYAVFALMSAGGSIGGFMIVTTAINNWFRRSRTMAMTIATQMSLGVGGLVVVPLLVITQDAFGWRAAAIGGGACAWAIGMPAALLMRRTPEEFGLRPDGDPPGDPHPRPPSTGSGQAVGEGVPRPSDRHPSPLPLRGSFDRLRTGLGKRGQSPGAGEVDFTLKEAVRTRAFWFLGIGHGLGAMLFNTAAVHQFAHMEEGVGLARPAAALVVTVLSVTSIGGSLAGGYLGDRMDKRVLLAIGTAGAALGLIVLATADSLEQAIAYAVISGLSVGFRGGPVVSSLRGDYFGRRSFGKIAGMSSLLTMPSSLLGPVFAGFMADRYGNYLWGFIALAGVGGASTLLFVFMRRPEKGSSPQSSSWPRGRPPPRMKMGGAGEYAEGTLECRRP